MNSRSRVALIWCGSCLLIGLALSLIGLGLQMGRSSAEWMSVARLGDIWIVVAWLILAIAALWLSSGVSPSVRSRATWLIPAALLLTVFTEAAMKLLFTASSHGLNDSLGYYPSGHAARASFILVSSAALAPCLSRICARSPIREMVWLVAVAFITVSGAALVVSGAHYLIDVIGGIALGVGAAVIAISLISDAGESP